MALSFLFWNLRRTALQDRLARMASSCEADFVILAEVPDRRNAEEELLGALNSRCGGGYSIPPTEGSRVLVISRLRPSLVRDAFNDPIGGLTIRHVATGPPGGFLLAAAHLPSRTAWSLADQALHASTVARDILREEQHLGVSHTVLVGDLNMNPYDVGVVGAQGLHGVMTRQIARRVGRVVAGRRYPFFYNPMWGLFGDRTEGPPATYYHRSSPPSSQFWHMYDQVLLRPSLMDKLLELRVLESDGASTLLSTAGLPDTVRGSDHLPLFFRLDV